MIRGEMRVGNPIIVRKRRGIFLKRRQHLRNTHCFMSHPIGGEKKERRKEEKIR